MPTPQPPSQPPIALLISGPSGSGKTTLAHLLHRHLPFPHALIDADNLDALVPEEQGNEVFLANFEALVRNYVRLRGTRVVLLVGTGAVLEAEGVRPIMESVAGGAKVRMAGVVLKASEETVAARLRGREGGVGEEVELHLGRSTRMRRVLEEAAPPWARWIETGEKGLRKLVEEVGRYFEEVVNEEGGS